MSSDNISSWWPVECIAKLIWSSHLQHIYQQTASLEFRKACTAFYLLMLKYNRIFNCYSPECCSQNVDWKGLHGLHHSSLTLSTLASNLLLGSIKILVLTFNKEGHETAHVLKFMANFGWFLVHEVCGRSTIMKFLWTSKLFLQVRTGLWVGTFPDILLLLNQNVLQTLKQRGCQFQTSLVSFMGVPSPFAAISLCFLPIFLHWICKAKNKQAN